MTGELNGEGYRPDHSSDSSWQEGVPSDFLNRFFGRSTDGTDGTPPTAQEALAGPGETGENIEGSAADASLAAAPEPQNTGTEWFTSEDLTDPVGPVDVTHLGSTIVLGGSALGTTGTTHPHDALGDSWRPDTAEQAPKRIDFGEITRPETVPVVTPAGLPKRVPKAQLPTFRRTFEPLPEGRTMFDDAAAPGAVGPGGRVHPRDRPSPPPRNTNDQHKGEQQ